MPRQRNVAAAAVAATMFVALPAIAADADQKRLSGEVWAEIENDLVYEAEDGSEANDVYATIEAAASLRLVDGLSLQVGLTFEPVQGPPPGQDRAFEDQGLYVDTLQFAYEGDGWFANAGKFTPAFALDQDLFPGLYGDTLAADYELTERMGVGGGATFDLPDFASLSVQAAIFKMDTSILSQAAVTSRGRLRESAGGPGNTSGLESVSLALDLGNFAAAPGLAVRASVLRQARGTGDADDQWAYSLGGIYQIDLGDDTVLSPMIDYVHSSDAIGGVAPASIAGAAEHYLTTGLGLARGPWYGAVTGGLRWDSQPGLPDSEDGFVQVSGGYDFENGVGVQVGWLYLDQADVSIQGVGAVVYYGLAF